MPDSKISSLPSAANLGGRDIVPVVIRSGASTYTNKKISVNEMFGNIVANTAINADLDVTGNTSLVNVEATRVDVTMAVADNLQINSNGIIISTKFTPGSSTIDDTQYPQGKFSYDANYLYIKVSANTIKRVALSSF